jgi:hypothetical protein
MSVELETQERIENEAENDQVQSFEHRTRSRAEQEERMEMFWTWDVSDEYKREVNEMCKKVLESTRQSRKD